MVRFCGIFASDSRHLKCAVALAEPHLRASAGSGRNRLGVGYYCGDEVLLTRRPTGQDLGLLALIGPAVGNHVLVGLDDSPPAQFRLEGTPPHRFRNYLGVWAVGNVHRKDFADRVLFNLPEYLARDIKAPVPGELMFHLFLSYLHDMGRLDARSVRPDTLVDALRSTFQLFPKVAEVGPGEAIPPLAACVTNGEHLVAATRGVSVWMRHGTGIESCPLCSDPARTRDHDPRRVDHPDVRVSAFLLTGSSEPPAGYAALPEGQVVAVTGGGDVLSRSI